MKDGWDANLQTLFADANTELDGEVFTGRTMSKTRSLRNRLIVALFTLALIAVASVLIFEIPMLGLAQQASKMLTITMFDLGDSWAAWIFDRSTTSRACSC